MQLYYGLRTKQSRKLREAVCTGVKAVQFEEDGTLWVGGRLLTGDEKLAFAKADGFPDFNDMWQWFNKTHDWPFDGWVIYW